MDTVKAARDTVDELIEGIQGRMKAFEAEIGRIASVRKELRDEVKAKIGARIDALPDLESVRAAAAALGVSDKVERRVQELRATHEASLRHLASFDGEGIRKNLARELKKGRVNLARVEERLEETRHDLRFKEGEIGYLGKGAFWQLAGYLEETARVLEGNDPKPSWLDRTFNGAASQELERRRNLRAEIARKLDEFKERAGSSFEEVRDRDLPPLKAEQKRLAARLGDLERDVANRRKRIGDLEREIEQVGRYRERAELDVRREAKRLENAAEHCKRFLHEKVSHVLWDGLPKPMGKFGDVGLLDRADIAKEAHRAALLTLVDGIKDRIKGYETDLTRLWGCVRHLDYAASPQLDGIQPEGKGTDAAVGFDLEPVKAASAEARKADLAILHGAAGLRADARTQVPEGDDVRAMREELEAKVAGLLSRDEGLDSAPGKVAQRIPDGLGMELGRRAETVRDPNRKVDLAM